MASLPARASLKRRFDENETKTEESPTSPVRPLCSAPKKARRHRSSILTRAWKLATRPGGALETHRGLLKQAAACFVRTGVCALPCLPADRCAHFKRALLKSIQEDPSWGPAGCTPETLRILVGEFGTVPLTAVQQGPDAQLRMALMDLSARAWLRYVLPALAASTDERWAGYVFGEVEGVATVLLHGKPLQYSNFVTTPALRLRKTRAGADGTPQLTSTPSPGTAGRKPTIFAAKWHTDYAGSSAAIVLPGSPEAGEALMPDQRHGHEAVYGKEGRGALRLGGWLGLDPTRFTMKLGSFAGKVEVARGAGFVTVTKEEQQALDAQFKAEVTKALPIQELMRDPESYVDSLQTLSIPAGWHMVFDETSLHTVTKGCGTRQFYGGLLSTTALKYATVLEDRLRQGLSIPRKSNQPLELGRAALRRFHGQQLMQLAAALRPDLRTTARCAVTSRKGSWLPTTEVEERQYPLRTPPRHVTENGLGALYEDEGVRVLFQMRPIVFARADK